MMEKSYRHSDIACCLMPKLSPSKGCPQQNQGAKYILRKIRTHGCSNIVSQGRVQAPLRDWRRLSTISQASKWISILLYWNTFSQPKSYPYGLDSLRSWIHVREDYRPPRKNEIFPVKPGYELNIAAATTVSKPRSFIPTNVLQRPLLPHTDDDTEPCVRPPIKSEFGAKIGSRYDWIQWELQKELDLRISLHHCHHQISAHHEILAAYLLLSSESVQRVDN